MKQKKYLIFILIGFWFLFLGNTLYASQTKQKVYIIPVSGTVEPGMAAYVKRAIEDIMADLKEKNKDEIKPVFVFKMDTFGGRVDAALDIVDTISNIPKGKTIAFVEKRAISAGALIALSSNLLFIWKSTRW